MIDDAEVDAWIAHAFSTDEAEDAIEDLLRRYQSLTAGESRHPASGRLWAALARLAPRQPDLGLQQRLFIGQAEWLEANEGPTAEDTIRAWAAVVEVANLDADWKELTRACEHIVAAVPDSATGELAAYLSDALRYLALRIDDRARARSFAERNVMLRRRIGPPEALARSLDSLASQCALDGEVERAIDLHRQRLAILERELPADDPRVKGAAAKIAELEAKRSGH